MLKTLNGDKAIDVQVEGVKLHAVALNLSTCFTHQNVRRPDQMAPFVRLGQIDGIAAAPQAPTPSDRVRRLPVGSELLSY